jgi:transcriptional regulator with XRE-family HTH domain
MTSFTKTELLDELQEIVLQHARAQGALLEFAAGYRMLFGREPADFDELCHFQNPEVQVINLAPLRIPMEQLPITRTFEQFYDYGLQGIRSMPEADNSGSNEWTFAYGFVSDAMRSTLISEVHNGPVVDARKCMHAAKAFFARLILDGEARTLIEEIENAPSDVLTMEEISILSGLDLRSVRNATSKNAPNRLETTVINSKIYIARDQALSWLSTKRGFVPTRIGEEFATLAVLDDEFSSSAEAGDFVRKCRERAGLSPAELIAAAKVTLTQEALGALENGNIPEDEVTLMALGNALGLGGQLFSLRMLEARSHQTLSDLARRILMAKTAIPTVAPAEPQVGERFSRAFSFVLQSNIEVYPVMMERQDNGNIAFRVSLLGNTLEDCEEVDEATMVTKVLNQGYGVRCASLDKKVTGLYKKGQRAVKAVRIPGASNENNLRRPPGQLTPTTRTAG